MALETRGYEYVIRCMKLFFGVIIKLRETGLPGFDSSSVLALLAGKVK